MEFSKKVLPVFVITTFFAFTTGNLNAQCFASPGNPVAGSYNIGVLDNDVYRVIGFYQYNLMDRYFQGSEEIDYNFPGAVSSANYNYTGLSIGYGITQNFSLEAETGYYFNKTQNYKGFDHSHTGKGLSNAVFSGKYNVYSDYGRFVQFSLSGGVKIPFSTEPQSVDGVELPVDVQPSTGNYGYVLQSFFVKEFDRISARMISINRYENNFTENKRGYRFGDRFSSSLFFSKHLANQYTDLTRDLTFILQGRYEYTGIHERDGNRIDNSGSNVVFIAPQLNYNLDMVWNFSVIFDLPVYQNYNGVQLANKYLITFTISKDIGFNI